MSCEEAVGKVRPIDLPSTKKRILCLQGTFTFISRQLEGSSLDVPFFFYYLPPPPPLLLHSTRTLYRGPTDSFLEVEGLFARDQGAGFDAQAWQTFLSAVGPHNASPERRTPFAPG
jgi:hypothetical protein